MTHREILLNGIELKETPRIPAIILSSGVWTYYRHGLSLQDAFDKPAEEMAAIVIKNNEELDSDIIWTAADCSNVMLHALGAKCTFDILGAAATIEEPLIANPSDVDKLSIQQLEDSSEMENLLNTTRIIANQVGNEYMIGISGWGPFTLAGQLMGTEKFMTTTIRDIDGAKHILEFTQRLLLKYWNLFIDAGAELVCQAEPSSSGDMISAKMFQNLALPYIRGANLSIKERAKARMLHICGNTTKILELIPDTDTDLFSLDHKVDLSLVREKLDNKVAFAGQLDPVRILLDGTPDSVRLATISCIESAGRSGGYIVMPGCDIPPKTSMENVRAMIETAHQM